MRKPALFVAVAAIAVFGIVATALAVTNTYTVSGSGTSPTKAGSKKHPVPVAIKFKYHIGEVNNQRPAPVNQYKINFAGLFVNTNAFKGCTASKINANVAAKGANADSVCPKGAKMGTGTIDATVGASNDPTQQGIKCALKLTFYNSRKNKAALFIVSDPSSSYNSSCPTYDIHSAIDANFVRSSSGTDLRFRVQGALLHPITGLDSAVTDVTSTIYKRVAKYHGKKVGYYQSAGGCRKGKRSVTVTFVQEDGQVGKAQQNVKCTK